MLVKELHKEQLGVQPGQEEEGLGGNYDSCSREVRFAVVKFYSAHVAGSTNTHTYL